MINNPTCKLFLSLSFVFSLTLTACGGGGEVEEIQWPQPVVFTDFTGGKTNFVSGVNVIPDGSTLGGCKTCITIFGVARSNTELGNLLPEWKTSSDWPPPYNGKLYSDLPIDYNSKIAVLVEDQGSGARYQHTIQKVEESAKAVTITIMKCSVGDLYGLRHISYFGLLLPKTNKPIEVLMVQSGKPPLESEKPSGLGAC